MADLKESIALCCKQLKISANFAERAMTQEGETNQEYLYNLLSNEVKYRTERRITKLLNTAGFPKMYTPEQLSQGRKPHLLWQHGNRENDAFNTGRDCCL